MTVQSEKIIRINPKYQKLWTTDAYIYLVSGGRMSGKSFVGAVYGDDITWEEGNRVVYARYTKASTEISIKDELLEKIELLGHNNDFSVTSNRIVNKHTGSDIIFMGMHTGSKKQTAAVKSIKDPTVLIIEEAEEIPDRKTFFKLVRSFRKKNAKIKIILLYNPPDDTHWMWDEFFKGSETEMIDGYPVQMSKDSRVCHIHTTWLDNKDNLNEDIIKHEILYTKENKPDEYAKDFIGVKGNPKTGKECYHKFTNLKHVKVREVDKSLPVHASFDQNVVPYIYTSLWQVHYEANKMILYCFDEVALKPPKSETGEVCKEIDRRHGDWMESIYLYGDASGNKRSTLGKDLTDYKIAKRELAEYIKYDSDLVYRKNPPVKKRLEFINKILSGEVIVDGYEVEVIINPKCKYMVADLSNVQKDANGDKHKEMESDDRGVRAQKYGHASDTKDYFVTKVVEKQFKAFLGKKKRRGTRTNR